MREAQLGNSLNCVILPFIAFVDTHLYLCIFVLFLWIHSYSYDYENTSHASSLQLPTYPISYSVQCEEGDELAARLAEAGTHYCPLVAAESPFQHSQRHLRTSFRLNFHVLVKHQHHPGEPKNKLNPSPRKRYIMSGS